MRREVYGVRREVCGVRREVCGVELIRLVTDIKVFIFFF